MAESKKVNYKRETATKHLLAMIERIKAINVDEKALQSIDRIEIFGSYTKGQETVHDLDVFIEVAETPYYNERLENEFDGNATKFNLGFASERGWGDRLFVYKLGSIIEDTYKKVKGKSCIISLHPYYEKAELKGVTALPVVVDGKIDEQAVAQLVNM